MVTSTVTTTIRISFITKNKLSAIGRKNQSFDSVVLSLLEEHYNNRKEGQNQQRMK